MAQREAKLRWGVVCDGMTVASWQASAVERLLAVEGASLALLVIAPSRSRTVVPTLLDVVRGRVSPWDLYGHRAAARSQATRPSDLRAVVAGVAARSLDEALSSMRGLDFVLWLCAAPPREHLLDLPRHGVWSLRHGGGGGGGAEAPCLAEVARGESVASASLVRERGPSAPARVLRRGFFAVAPQSYARTLDQVLLGSAWFPADACRALLAGGPAAELPALDDDPPPLAPRVGPALLPLVRVGAALLRAHVDTLLFFEQWNVGIVDSPIDAFLEPGFVPEVRWLPLLARHRFLADPFGLSREPPAILVEDYDYRIATACISVVEQAADGSFSAPRPVLELPVELSYPCLFEEAGEVYCVPAMEGLGQVRLYRARRFPADWEQVAVLLEGRALADPTLFRHEGRYWLLGTDHETGSWTRLYAFFAESLLGPWEPHAANPVKTDVRSSRPAGTPFVAGGRLYRPAQDCSRVYGGAVTINRVLRLTPSEFAEEPVRVVEPDRRGPFGAGLHTLTAMGGRTVIDAKRKVVIGVALRRELERKLARLRRPSGGPTSPGDAS